MELHGILQLLDIRPLFHAMSFTPETERNLGIKPGTREERKNKVTLPDLIEQTRFPGICLVDLGKQICDVVCLAKVIQNVIVLGVNPKFLKGFLECPGLFKQAKYFINTHRLCLLPLQLVHEDVQLFLAIIAQIEFVTDNNIIIQADEIWIIF